MAVVSSARADRFVANPPYDCMLFILHGPDQGLITERADAIVAASGIDTDDPHAYIRMDADRAATRGMLVEEASTIALFAGKRLIRVTGQTSRNLASAIAPIIETPPVDCRIVIEAGDLRKDAPLRKAAASSRHAAAIACYMDGPRELEQLVETTLTRAGLRIGRDAMHLLVDQLGGDRRASRNEIEKLVLYCAEAEEITVDDISSIVGDVSALEIDRYVLSALTGKATEADRRFGRLVAGGHRPDMILQAALRMFQDFQSVHAGWASSGRSAAAFVNAAGPRMHFMVRAAYEAAFPLWSPLRLQSALERIDDSIHDARARPALAEAIAGRTLLSIALEASRHRR